MEHYRQVNELHFQPYIRDIRDPQLVDARQRHAPCQIGVHAQVVIGIGCDYELPLPQAQQIVLAQDAAHPPVARIPSPPLQLGSDSRPAITRKLQSNALDLVPQIQILVGRLSVRVKSIEGGPADLPHFAHSLDRHLAAFLELAFDLPAGRGLPVSACSIRSSSMRCKHPFKKSISRVCLPTFLSSGATLVSSQRRFPPPGKALPGPWRNSFRHRCSRFGLTSNARATSETESPAAIRRT